MTLPRLHGNLRPPAARSFGLAVAAVGWAISGLGAQPAPADPYVLAPDSVGAGFPFDLALKDSQFTCADAFSHDTVSISSSTINLGFTTQNDTTAHCSRSDTLFGPVFALPALDKGRYSVYASEYPACYFSEPRCLTAIAIPAPVLAGTLTVGDSAGPDSWFLRPTRVVAQDTFTLQLLNNYYGNCPTWFSHTSLVQQHDSLIASFVVENDSARLCLVDLHPFGPSYAAPALPAGKYPVFSSQHLDCEYTPPYCPVAYRPPQLVDTLTVSGPAALVTPALRKRSAADASGWEEAVRGYRLNGRKLPGVTPVAK